MFEDVYGCMQEDIEEVEFRGSKRTEQRHKLKSLTNYLGSQIEILGYTMGEESKLYLNLIMCSNKLYDLIKQMEEEENYEFKMIMKNTRDREKAIVDFMKLVMDDKISINGEKELKEEVL